MHLYLHIPFCRQACHYCDFHFSTNLSRKMVVVDALCAEIALRKDYLPNQPLETIYLGGGTPSLLTQPELAQLFGAIHNTFTVLPTAEITLEANPDDLTAEKLAMLRRYVNRLSIGIQTFDEATLRWMNRAHTATEAENCVRLAQEAGFDNLSIDLIYGIPNRTESLWQADLQKVVALDIPHISAYALTIEPDTAFGRWQKTGKLLSGVDSPADENLAATQFEELMQTLTGKASLGLNLPAKDWPGNALPGNALLSYEHYEISNFARPGQYARHNTAYWQQKPYLGIGPSAHSYNGHSRQFNIANNTQYVTAIGQGIVPATVEELTPTDRVNEYLLTGLRTQWGCSLPELDRLLGNNFAHVQSRDLTALYASGWLTNEDDWLRLTNAGKLFADRVASTLFVE